jgi:hypothetical protein
MFVGVVECLCVVHSMYQTSPQHALRDASSPGDSRSKTSFMLYGKRKEANTGVPRERDAHPCPSRSILLRASRTLHISGVKSLSKEVGKYISHETEKHDRAVPGRLVSESRECSFLNGMVD